MKIILGPPGTGKTTKLLSLVESYLEKGVEPDRIGYFAFTRRAANEAIERACLRFNLSKKDLPYFRTLHSLAFVQAGLRHNQIMKEAQYQEAANWLKIGKFFIDRSANDQGPFKDFGYGDKFLEVINLSRILRQPLRKVYTHSTVPLKTDWSRVEYVDRGLTRWKKEFGLFDFTDMLEYFITNKLSPRFEVLFIDEAQDLSPIQWEMVRHLEENSKECYIAGDDDQAIFRYAGADVKHFVELKGDVTLLDKSYRIPASHHRLSQDVIKRIVGRREKIFSPRQEEGFIHWHSHSEEVDLSSNDWLLLSRTGRGAKQIEEEVRRRGHLYSYNSSQSIDHNVLEAVRLWELLLQGERITAEKVRLVYKQMLSKSQIAYGQKSMPKGEEGKFYSLVELQQEHGLLHAFDWENGLGKISENDKNYIKACLRKGESLADKPRIRISTIHSAKGAQATNVMLLTDVMRRPYSIWRKMDFFEEDEARVFYVGLTRARKELHLIHPMFSQGYNLPY